MMEIPHRFRWIFAVLLLWPCCDSAHAEMTRVEKLKSKIEEKKKARTELEKKIVEATDLEAWILASMPIQPLVVKIIRSMEPGSEIERLQLERDAETPSQLRIRLVLNTASDKQLEETLKVIHEMNFRESNQSCTRSDGQLVYTARLVWQAPPSQSRQTGAQRQQPSANLPSSSQNEPQGVDAGAEERELQTQLDMEERLLADLEQQAANLLNFVSFWEPYFVLLEEQQTIQTLIRKRVGKEGMLTPSQRYEQVPHQIANKDIASLPVLMRATLELEDGPAKLLNWLGTMEKDTPTMRVGKLALTEGSRSKDLRMELTLEVPLRRRGS